MSTFVGKKERVAVKAKDLCECNESMYLFEILDTVNKSKIYGDKLDLHSFDNSYVEGESPYGLVDIGSVEAAFKYGVGKTCILNFASYKNPGGGFLKGSMAQEESLCHSSVLYNILSRFDEQFYEYNRKHTNRSLYLDRAIYSPNVVFMCDDKVKKFDVITCAAPNFGAANKYSGVSINENSIVLSKRIKFILDILTVNKCDTVILGAFGCGVFGQDSIEVAELFLSNAVLNRGFEKVIFAVPDKNSSNYA